MIIPSSHQAFIDNALPILREDDRLLGVAAAGSFITEELDEFSDLDFVIVVDAPFYETVMLERSLIASRLGTLLTAFTGEHVGEPRLLICLYDHPILHVDLKFVRLEAFRTDRVEDPVILWERGSLLSDAVAAFPASYPPVDPQWIEDRFWTWVHYAGTKIGRGELFESIDGLAFLRRRVLAPLAKMRAGLIPRGVRFLERELPEDLPSFQATHPTGHTASAIADAMLATVDLYRRLRDQADLPGLIRHAAAEEAATRYLAAVIARVSTPLPD